MPMTINGVGTRYVGKSNVSVRGARCEHCHRESALESYDTRLFFVVFFIPVIPLGRKRIVDECSSCSRHYAVNAEQYQEARAQTLNESMEKFRAQPSPETAAEFHGVLLATGDSDRAAKLRKVALERFPSDVDMLMAMAAQLEHHLTDPDDVRELVKMAYKQAPDRPELRGAVAQLLIEEGKLDQARELVAFLEAPGASERYSLEILDELAQRYALTGEPEKAYALYQVLLRETPQIGQRHDFRKRVLQTEQTLGRVDSILPPVGSRLAGLFAGENSPYSGTTRFLVLGGAAAALLLVALVISNDYFRRHRTLHVVNVFDQPIEVQVDDRTPVVVRDVGAVELEEGAHKVRVTGAVDESHEIVMESDYFDRWTKSPAWVLNPGKEAVLVEMTLHYTRDGDKPPEERVEANKALMYFEDVDYPFVEPPDSIRTKSRGVTTKRHVYVLEGDKHELFWVLLFQNEGGAFEFAETVLTRDPSQTALLEGYAAAAQKVEAKRAEEFLKQGLQRRPIDVQWHRFYQETAKRNRGEELVIAEYDQMVGAEPTNSNLLYLRARIEPNGEKQEEFLQRSIQADPTSSWPWMMQAVQSARRGEWEKTLETAARAHQLGCDPKLVDHVEREAWLALGETDALLRACRSEGAQEYSEETLLQICEALVAAERFDEIAVECAAFDDRLMANGVELEGPPFAIKWYKADIEYMRGQLDACVKSFLAQEEPAGPLRGQALLAAGRTKEAIAAFEEDGGDPFWTNVAAMVGLLHEGKKSEADAFGVKSTKLVENAISHEHKEALKLLQSASPPALDAIYNARIDRGNTALLFLALGMQFPEQRDVYFERAKHFNIHRSPPYHFVNRVLETTPARSTAGVAR